MFRTLFTAQDGTAILKCLPKYNPNTDEQAIRRQFSEISYRERSEKQLAVVLHY